MHDFHCLDNSPLFLPFEVEWLPKLIQIQTTCEEFEIQCNVASEGSVYVYMYVYMCIYDVYVLKFCWYIIMCMCMCVHMYVYVSTCIYVSVYMCVSVLFLN